MATLNVPTLAIITGASRGFGQSTAFQLAKEVGPGSLVYLTARTYEGLEKTALQIKRNFADKVEVKCVLTDLSSEQSINEMNRNIFGTIGDVSRFSHAIIIHNAASLGIITKNARELNNVEYIQKFFLLHMTAPIVMTSLFLKCTNGCQSNSLRKTIVQISSVSGSRPQKSMHLYCAAKSGRDMFFSVMAIEHPNFRILTYDPGSMDTKMFTDALKTNDAEFRARLNRISSESCFLPPEKSASVLIKVLQEDKYENAVKVHCYDVLDLKVNV